MRIITGILKGRKIDIPNTLDVRPTTDRTKEGLFSVIEARRYIRNTKILDLFAGSGNLGIEAISRGASSVLFVDNDRRNIRHIETLGREFEISDRIRTAISDVKTFLNGPQLPYDIVFSDPPYDYPYMEEMIDTVTGDGWLYEGGWFILEHDKRHDFNDHPDCVFSKAYGRTIVSIFVNRSGTHADDADPTDER
ncbi:MAG: 16S rRNA (guanine(966)-N(2))-methyltransferase RsmD [Balneolaceae bacterium]|nr:16S rRNA (guanine(966)-N(2))-methyltransferase RsmD [Balneolaceae bacterium]